MIFKNIILFSTILCTIDGSVQAIQSSESNKNNPSLISMMPEDIFIKIGEHLLADDIGSFGATSQRNYILATEQMARGYQQVHGDEFIKYNLNDQISRLKLEWDAQHLGSKEPLKIKGTGVTANNIRELLELYANNVKALDLKSCYIGDDGVEYIANAKSLDNLTYLNLSANYIKTEGARAIAGSGNLSSLAYLNLSRNHIGDRGIKYITNSENLLHLTYLNLSWNKISAEGVQIIANTRNLDNLTYLNLSCNNIKDEGAQHIANSNFPNLTFLSLVLNKIEIEEKRNIRTRYPSTSILF